MKIKCVNSLGVYRLTRHKEYAVLDTQNDFHCYKIVNDKGNEQWYAKDRFEIIKEKEMEDKKFVKCIDNTGINLDIGSVYEVTQNKRYSDMWSIVGMEECSGYFKNRFVDYNAPNGIDAIGNPKYFDESMLKDFQLVKVKSFQSNDIKYGFLKKCQETFCVYYMDGHDYVSFSVEKYKVTIVEVLEQQNHIYFGLNPIKLYKHATLLWKANEPVIESASQKAIRELRESIEQSQKKLEELEKLQ